MSDHGDWIEQGEWRAYEAYVHGLLSAAFPGIRFESDTRLAGNKSGVFRQIDILAHSTPLVAIECKSLGRKVDVKCVEAFLGMLDDIGLQLGIIVTAIGFTSAAQRRVERERQIIDLQILPPDRLSDYQFRGTPLIWRDPIGISFEQIEGWTIDTELTGTEGGTLMMTYPLGHSRASATRAAPVIYANLLTRPLEADPLHAAAAPHEAQMLADYPAYHFSSQRLTLSDRRGIGRAALLRQASGPPPIFGEEHALYIDYGRLILLLVLCAPPGQSDALQPKLLGLYQNSFQLDVKAGQAA